MSSERVNNWLHGFWEFVKNDTPEILPLYAQRIHFFPNQDKDETIRVGLDDLHEPYTDAETIKKMRELFEQYAAQHEV